MFSPNRMANTMSRQNFFLLFFLSFFLFFFLLFSLFFFFFSSFFFVLHFFSFPEESFFLPINSEYFALVGILTTTPEGINLLKKFRIFTSYYYLTELKSRDDIIKSIITRYTNTPFQ